MTQDDRHPRAAVAVITPGQAAVQRAGEWSQREAGLIASVISPGLTTDELRVYAAICRHTGLDPFKREIYAWKDKGRLVIHIAIGGWRGMAARSGTYGGQTSVEWCGPDGQWRDVWLEDGPPAAARAGVYRVGNPTPMYSVVLWREFQRTQQRMGAKGPTPWDDRPAHQLGIRAEYHALQRACPEAFEATREALASLPRGLDVTVEAVDESEIPAPAAVAGLAAPVEATAPEPEDALGAAESGSAAGYAWEDTLREELAVASLDVKALAALLGRPATYQKIDEWLSAGEGRTVHSLVSAAADALAARQ